MHARVCSAFQRIIKHEPCQSRISGILRRLSPLRRYLQKCRMLHRPAQVRADPREARHPPAEEMTSQPNFKQPDDFTRDGPSREDRRYLLNIEVSLSPVPYSLPLPVLTVRE